MLEGGVLHYEVLEQIAHPIYIIHMRICLLEEGLSHV